jgi:16S rRNA (cytosine967-C5)-methyltransferase
MLAFRTLVRVETRGSYAVELLNAGMALRLSPPDHALAQEITFGCLRHQGELDWLITHYATRTAEELDPEIRVTLRMGIYQLRFLDRIPAHAAVDQSVGLAHACGKSSASGLVNAVLRKVNRVPIAMPEAARLSTPPWLLKRWGAEVSALNNERPVTFLRTPPGAESDLLRGHYVRNCVVFEDTCGVAPFPIQDEGSQMIPYLLDAQASHWILDLCSAPGNKATQLGELAPGAKIVACDFYQARLMRVTTNMRVALDGTLELPFSRQFHRILIDAPCSGTGTVRRNPEIKWKLTPPDLRELAGQQVALIRSAIHALAPRGRLVYSTCSIEPEENERVVEMVLSRQQNVRLIPAVKERERLKDAFTPEGLALLGDPYFRAMPSAHGADGFFAAVLERI